MTSPRELADRLEKEPVHYSSDSLIDDGLLCEAITALRTLADQQEQDKQDAERWRAYRKYRATPADELSAEWLEFITTSVCGQDLEGAMPEPDLDAAIDAARAQEPKT